MRWRMSGLVAAPISRLGNVRCGKNPLDGASCEPFVNSVSGHEPTVLSFVISGKSLSIPVRRTTLVCTLISPPRTISLSLANLSSLSQPQEIQKLSHPS